MTIYVTSDTHFGHANVIKYCNRPWASVDEMNEGIVERWNAIVRPEDTVYHLGDVALNPKKAIPFLERLNGRKRLIRGNHDHDIEKYLPYFEWVKDYYVLKDNGMRFILFHYPISSWDGLHRGTVHLHGHSHGSHLRSFPASSEDGKRIDAGTDCWGWAPVALTTVAAVASALDIKSVDHHNEGDLR